MMEPKTVLLLIAMPVALTVCGYVIGVPKSAFPGEYSYFTEIAVVLLLWATISGPILVGMVIRYFFGS